MSVSDFQTAAREAGSRPPLNIDEPDIFRVDRDVSPVFLRALHDAERVHHFADGPEGRDMRTRLGHTNASRGRRCVCAWKNPEAPKEDALISVQVALMHGMPDRIQTTIDVEDELAGEPDTAAFYSISSWGRVKAPLGRPFLIAVAADIRKNNPSVNTFCTLSPMPDFRGWVTEKLSDEILAMVKIEMTTPVFKAKVLGAGSVDGLTRARIYDSLQKLAAFYILNERKTNRRGDIVSYDDVAQFHMSNGARAERLCIGANSNDKGFRESFGFMINYLYDEEHINQRMLAYNQGEIDFHGGLRSLLPRETLLGLRQGRGSSPQFQPGA